MATEIERKAPRSSASGSVGNLEAVAGSSKGRSPKAKKVASQPTASQLKKAANRARQAGIEPLAKKYEKVADAAAKCERKTTAKPLHGSRSSLDAIDR